MKVIAFYSFVIFIVSIINVVIDIVRKQISNIKWMSKNYTTIIKGVAIIMVIMSHIGNVNDFRYLAPLGGIGVSLFLICSGYGLNESSKNSFRLLIFG